LELEKNPRFADLRHSSLQVISIGSFEQYQVAFIDEYIMEQHSEHARREYISMLSTIVGRKKTTHFLQSKKKSLGL
jgi:hypothetical protein